jgi:ArsR family transcriptional regulator
MGVRVEVVALKAVEVMKALSDESRIRIASLLTEKELCVCEIEAILDMSQSNVSRHLMKLKNAGIVDARRESQWIFYSVNEAFGNENGSLMDYVKKMAECEPQYRADKAKLGEYLQSGMNCEQLVASMKNAQA